jgi:hypothetical protein
MNEPSFGCSLTDQRLRVRLEEWLALDERSLLRVEDRPNGRVHVLRASDETERVLAALIEAEQRCCPFLDFTVQRRQDEVWVSVSFAEEARGSPVVQIIERMGRSPWPPPDHG